MFYSGSKNEIELILHITKSIFLLILLFNIFPTDFHFCIKDTSHLYQLTPNFSSIVISFIKKYQKI